MCSFKREDIFLCGEWRLPQWLDLFFNMLLSLGDDQSSEEPTPYVPSEEPEPPPDEEDPFNWFDWRSWMDLIQKQ